MVAQTQKLIIMKAICIHCENDFDPRVGEIVDLDENFYITRLIRNGSILDLENPQRPGYFRPESEILALLKEGDEVEENYCHGIFRVVS